MFYPIACHRKNGAPRSLIRGPSDQSSRNRLYCSSHSAWSAVILCPTAWRFSNSSVIGIPSRSSSAGELHPCDRVTGGSYPPPVPTERGVRFLLRCTFGVPHHALRQMIHGTLLLFVP